MNNADRNRVEPSPGGFLSELRRRKVLRVATAYIVGAWLLTEVADFLLAQAGAPAWIDQLLAIAFIVGFPVTVILVWIVRREKNGSWSVDSSQGQMTSVVGAAILGAVLTAGLSWLILPDLEPKSELLEFQPLPNSVAILPIAEAGATPREKVMAETLHAALVEGLNHSLELAQIRLRIDEPPVDLAAFGRKLRMSSLLHGRIWQVPGGSRFEMTLLDVAHNRTIWSEAYDWNSARIMEVGTDIANGVLAAMELPGIQRKTFSGTDNRHAFDALLLGHRYMGSFRVEDLSRAIVEFERAAELDPNFVGAWTSLGSALMVYTRSKGPSQSEKELLEERARQALETAVALDADSAEANSALSWLVSDRKLRIRMLEHALEIDPNHQLSYKRLGFQKWWDGDLEEAERLFRKAVALNPMDANDRFDLGELLWEKGNASEAMTEIRHSIELRPDNPEPYRLLGLIEMFGNGRIDNAVIQGRKAYALDSENGGLAGFVAGAYAALGARNEALAWLQRSDQLSPTSGWTLSMGHLTHLMLGNRKQALVHAERAWRQYPQLYRALFYLGMNDIESGRPMEAFERWRDAFPILAAGKDISCDQSNYSVIVAYADNLKMAGESGDSTELLMNCLPVVEAIQMRMYPEARMSRILILLGRREEALKALRKEVVEEHGRLEMSFTVGQPAYDPLRQDPDFMNLMQIIEIDLEDQLKRVRKMDRNGELSPSTGVER